MLSTAVSTYWKSSQPNINRIQQLDLFSNSLREIDQSSKSSKKLSLSARTAVTWLHRMGYDWKEVKKGVYKDGHERPNVVYYRQEIFLKWLEEVQFRMPFPIKNDKGEVVDIGQPSPSLLGNQRLCIPITHDECTCNADDGAHHQWIKDNENPLRKKSCGQRLHISEFITPWGRLTVLDIITDKELLRKGLHKWEATEIIQCGGDIWWNQDHIVQQTLVAITIFETAYPHCQGLFLFDNATSHCAYAQNALRASRMNKGWGGKQPVMRDGYFTDKEGKRVIQKMTFKRHNFTSSSVKTHPIKKMWGEPKGLQVVLEERGLWPSEGLYLDCTTRKNLPKDQQQHSLTSNDCCARHLLSQ